MSRSRRKSKEYLQSWLLQEIYYHKQLWKYYGKCSVRCRFKDINKDFGSGGYYKKINFHGYLI